MQPTKVREFDNEAAAHAWMMDCLHGESCIDGYRFAFDDDAEAVARYEAVYDSGCCGYFDRDIIVGGRPARIGCNFGH